MTRTRKRPSLPPFLDHLEPRQLLSASVAHTLNPTNCITQSGADVATITGASHDPAIQNHLLFTWDNNPQLFGELQFPPTGDISVVAYTPPPSASTPATSPSGRPPPLPPTPPSTSSPSTSPKPSLKTPPPAPPSTPPPANPSAASSAPSRISPSSAIPRAPSPAPSTTPSTPPNPPPASSASASTGATKPPAMPHSSPIPTAVTTSTAPTPTSPQAPSASVSALQAPLPSTPTTPALPGTRLQSRQALQSLIEPTAPPSSPATQSPRPQSPPPRSQFPPPNSISTTPISAHLAPGLPRRPPLPTTPTSPSNPHPNPLFFVVKMAAIVMAATCRNTNRPHSLPRNRPPSAPASPPHRHPEILRPPRHGIPQNRPAPSGQHPLGRRHNLHRHYRRAEKPTMELPRLTHLRQARQLRYQYHLDATARRNSEHRHPQNPPPGQRHRPTPSPPPHRHPEIPPASFSKPPSRTSSSTKTRSPSIGATAPNPPATPSNKKITTGTSPAPTPTPTQAITPSPSPGRMPPHRHYQDTFIPMSLPHPWWQTTSSSKPSSSPRQPTPPAPASNPRPSRNPPKGSRKKREPFSWYTTPNPGGPLMPPPNPLIPHSSFVVRHSSHRPRGRKSSCPPPPSSLPQLRHHRPPRHRPPRRPSKTPANSKFSFDIVDEQQRTPPDVHVQITRHAARVGVLLFEADHEKPAPPRTLSDPFTYSTFGNMAVEVACTKPGYDPATFLFTDQDNLELPPPHGFIFMRTVRKTPINIKTSPHSHLVLLGQVSAGTNPRSPPLQPRLPNNPPPPANVPVWSFSHSSLEFDSSFVIRHLAGGRRTPSPTGLKRNRSATPPSPTLTTSTTPS